MNCYAQHYSFSFICRAKSDNPKTSLHESPLCIKLLKKDYCNHTLGFQKEILNQKEKKNEKHIVCFHSPSVARAIPLPGTFPQAKHKKNLKKTRRKSKKDLEIHMVLPPSFKVHTQIAVFASSSLLYKR